MGIYRTEAVVLRSRKYREADCLLTLLTENKGKVGAIAKGVRKPTSSLRAGVQVFTHNDMLLYKGRSLDTVTQSQCLEAFTPLHEDIQGMTAAAYWSELLEALTPEGEGDPELFRLALAGYHVLSLSVTELILRGLEIKLLALLGYRPYLEKCVSCGCPVDESPKITFAVKQGGVLCPSCSSLGSRQHMIFFTHEALQVWQQLQRMDLSKMNRLKVSNQGLSVLDRAMEEYLLMQLDYPLKSRPIIKTML